MKLVILDRDGVINEDSDNYIRSVDDWRPIPGSLEAISKLNKAGFIVVVATNQSGIARGFFDLNTFREINDKMLKELNNFGGKIDKIYFCPHGPNDNCDCRKPKTYMFTQISQDFNVDLKDTICIGDSLRDIQAGQASGCKCFLVLTGKKKSANFLGEVKKQSVEIFDNLYSAVESLLRIRFQNVSRETF